MGVTSSQFVEEAMERERRSNERKSKHSKTKSPEVETAIDQEQESARALLQMRGAPLRDSENLSHGDDIAVPLQLVCKSSPFRDFDKPIDLAKMKKGRKGKPRKRIADEKNPTRKKSRGDPFEFSGSEERDCGRIQHPNLPSTPPRQITQSTSSPYRPRLSQPNHALDEIPTDDEEVTLYMQEFAKQEEDAPKKFLEDDEIHVFPQQSQDEISSTYQLPTGKSKKRKRAIESMSERLPDDQTLLTTREGQHTPDIQREFGALDELFRGVINSANCFPVNKANNIPIDPELHSISQLPPSVDLSQLNNAGENLSQKQKRKEKIDTSSQLKKRRRVDEVHNKISADRSHHSRCNYDRDQEDMQDQVLPGFEDLQRQSSPELGSPLMKNIAQQGLEYMNDKVQPKTPQQKKKKDLNNNVEAPANKRSTKNSEDVERSVKEVAGKGGPFTGAEASKLDAFRDAYCDANDMSTVQFNSRIQTKIRGNADVAALFNEIQDVLPYRPRMSVQRFCRRRFHNFTARGTWTPEDDEMLRQACAEKPNQWKTIGDMVDRMADDCRDRYRNYILGAENRNHEAWTVEEVQSLCKAVQDAADAIKDQRRQGRRGGFGDAAAASDSDSDIEAEDMKSINWQLISNEMKGRRSRLQCSGKWRQLEPQEKKLVAQSNLDGRGLQGRRLQTTKNPWRMKNAVKKAANMKPGDKHALVQAILDCGLAAEGNIPWKALGDEDLRATWNSAAKKAAWSKMKQDVPNSQSMNYRDVASHLLTKIEDECANDLEERWDPEVHGDLAAKRSRKSRKNGANEVKGEGTTANGRTTRKKVRRNYKEAQMKSKEFVQESEDEDQEVHSTLENHQHNRFSSLRSSEGGQKNLSANGSTAPDDAGLQPGPVTNGIDSDEDSGSRYTESVNGDNDGNGDDLMIDPDISPRMEKVMRQALGGALRGGPA